MRTLRLALFIFLASLPLSVLAEFSADKLPEKVAWYGHIDLEAMRKGNAGNSLYLWLDDEVFEEILEDTGIDVGNEASQVTAFASPDSGIVIIVDGEISQKSRDKLLAIATLSGDMESFETGGKPYYFVSDADKEAHGPADMNVDSLEDSAYFSLALKNKIVVTSSENTMKALLASNGKVTVPSDRKGALLVLSADRNLMQAGINADEFDYDDDWNSNVLKNAKEVAILVADEGDTITVEAQLVTMQPEMANSLASIVRGLISLQVFSNDLDPAIKDVLNSARVDVDGSSLRLRVALKPDVVIAAISD